MQGLPPPFDLTAAAFSPRKASASAGNGPLFRGSPLAGCGSPSPLGSPMGVFPSPTEPANSGSEPRKRAPRALTGRYVRSGTGASPATLEILRKKILERMQLKEMLGENSHLFFGALNKQGKNAKNGGGGGGLFPRKK